MSGYRCGLSQKYLLADWAGTLLDPTPILGRMSNDSTVIGANTTAATEAALADCTKLRRVPCVRASNTNLPLATDSLRSTFLHRTAVAKPPISAYPRAAFEKLLAPPVLPVPSIFRGACGRGPNGGLAVSR